MIEDLKTAKQKVAKILEKHPATRDSDKLLWLAYLCIFHDLKSVIGDEAYDRFKNLILSKDTPTMESIRRVRQKHQEEGLYVGNKRKDRLEEAQRVRAYYS